MNMMRLTEIGHIIEGKLISDGDFEILDYCNGVQRDKKAIAFLTKPEFADTISEHIECIICNEECLEEAKKRAKGVFLVKYPKAAFYQLHNHVVTNEKKNVPTRIGKNCQISSLAAVAEKNVIIGDNVVIEDFAVVHENTIIGNDSIIHSHAVAGGKAFVFARLEDGSSIQVVDAGITAIGERVEVCSLTHIARGVLAIESTVLENDVKVDALVHIGHGAYIGKGSYIIAGSQIGGCTSIGDMAWLGINSTVSNRIDVGSHAKVSLGSVVTKDVKEHQTVTGNFAIDHGKFIQNLKQSI